VLFTLQRFDTAKTQPGHARLQNFAVQTERYEYSCSGPVGEGEFSDGKPNGAGTHAELRVSPNVRRTGIRMM
jgi:hypothetical protein